LSPAAQDVERNLVVDISNFSSDWDKRNSRRQTVGVLVLIPGGKKAMTRNLSQEGCFIEGVDLGPVDAAVAIQIDFPGFGTLPLEGRVVNKGREGEGTGLEFIALTPEAIDWLDQFLQLFNA
jgi:hypothetical protein